MTKTAGRAAGATGVVLLTLGTPAAEHFDETQLGALVLDIATVNLWNRLNIATRQAVGEHNW